MSGAEVAGLVLGAIPLLISGLEHYGEGVRTLQKMKNASTEFRKLKRILECEHVMFLNSLEILLKDDVDDHTLPTLLTNVGQTKAWRDPSLDQCLRRRLGRSYAIYLDCARDLDRTIAEFIASLKLTADGKGPFDHTSKRSVNDCLKKIKFGLKMKAYQELMEEISASNQRLRRLTDQNINLEPVREMRRRQPDFERGRGYANSLFAILEKRLLNSCALGHTASVYMKSAESSQNRKPGDPHSDRLRIVLHHRTTDAAHNPPLWMTTEAEVEPLPVLSGDELASQSSRGNVRFAVQSVHVVPHRQQDFQEIHDLCASLHSVSEAPTPAECDLCLGYVSDTMINQRHGFYRPRKPLVDEKASATLALAHILNPSSSYRLGEVDKKCLALALASGMLRLHNTPWLQEQWGKDEVVLFRRPGGLVTSHPFISAEVSRQPKQQILPNAKPKYFRPCQLIKEQTVFALGILLIELALETPFEQLIGPEDLLPDGTKHELTDFCAADRLVDEVYLRAEGRYGDVVRRCIRCEFDHKRSSLLDAEFRRKVYNGVIAELELDVDDVLNL